MIAASDGTVEWADDTYTFKASKQLVEQAQEWSRPVRFRFAILANGRVELVFKEEPA